jgi:hypothetical protein
MPPVGQNLPIHTPTQNLSKLIQIMCFRAMHYFVVFNMSLLPKKFSRICSTLIKVSEKSCAKTTIETTPPYTHNKLLMATIIEQHSEET